MYIDSKALIWQWNAISGQEETSCGPFACYFANPSTWVCETGAVSSLILSVIGVLRWNDEARPFPRSWHRFPPIAGVSDMAGTGGGWGGAARGLFSEPVPPQSAWKKSQDETGGRRGGQGRAFSPQTRAHLRLLWRRASEIFHHGHCGGSPSLAVQPHLSFVILVQLGLIY